MGKCEQGAGLVGDAFLRHRVQPFKASRRLVEGAYIYPAPDGIEGTQVGGAGVQGQAIQFVVAVHVSAQVQVLQPGAGGGGDAVPRPAAVFFIQAAVQLRPQPVSQYADLCFNRFRGRRIRRQFIGNQVACLLLLDDFLQDGDKIARPAVAGKGQDLRAVRSHENGRRPGPVGVTLADIRLRLGIGGDRNEMFVDQPDHVRVRIGGLIHPAAGSAAFYAYVKDDQFVRLFRLLERRLAPLLPGDCSGLRNQGCGYKHQQHTGFNLV